MADTSHCYHNAFPEMNLEEKVGYDIMLGCCTLSMNQNRYFLLQAWIKSWMISVITLLPFRNRLQFYVHQQLQKPLVTD